MGDFAYDGDIYAAIRDRLYANYSNLTNVILSISRGESTVIRSQIYCIVSYKDSPTDLDTYNECTAYFKSGTALRFISNIWTIVSGKRWFSVQIRQEKMIENGR